MKTILSLGAGKEQIAGFDLAHKKDLKVVAFDMDENAPGKNFADEFYPINIRDVNKILSFLKEYNGKIDGVITFGIDVPHAVSAAAEFLGLKCISRKLAENCVNKLKMKEILRKNGVNVPDFCEVKNIDDLKNFIKKVGYPMVLKPVDNAGAKGVLRINERIDLDWAFEYSKKYSFSGQLIAEKFLNGPQVSNEGMMYENKFYIAGFADRNYSLLEKTTPYIIENGGEMPSFLPKEKQDLINLELEKAVRALGIDWGPGKGDMLLGEDGKAYVVEIAARLSGGNFCFDKIPLTTGIDLPDILIDMCLGEKISLERFNPTKNLASCQRYFFPKPGKIKSVLGLDEAKKLENIHKIELWIGPGDSVLEAENHTLRSGYVISLAENRDKAVRQAEEAIKSIKFGYESDK